MSDTQLCRHDRRFHLMFAKNGCCACELEEASATIARLQAIVDRLPTTADGVPVTPGMPIYDDTGKPYDGGHTVEADGHVRRFGGWLIRASQCYSTPEAVNETQKRAGASEGGEEKEQVQEEDAEGTVEEGSIDWRRVASRLKTENDRLVEALFTIRDLTMRRIGTEMAAKVAADAVAGYDEPAKHREENG